ncbi:MAG: AIR synthase family protein [Armatimonadetes bacterium]|nr:AIR synthase family protein [Armatimonadota bacterium]
MDVGKLPHQLLAEMLARLRLDDRVLVGPGIGIDATVIEFGERLLVVKTDPITFATDLIGWYAVNVNANDLAVMGADPKWMMVTLLLPVGTSEKQVSILFDQLVAACAEFNISWVGGHTEITYDLHRPIVVGCMLGETTRTRLVTASGARVGDDLILTKAIAVEGTALIAREARDLLIQKGISSELIDRAANFLFDPGISVLRDAKVAQMAGHVTAMHDPTEGGLATGLMEIAQASGLGLEIDSDAIPIFPETREICQTFALAPLGLIASGSLLIASDPSDSSLILDALDNAGITARRIGRLMPRKHGLRMRSARGLEDLPLFKRDELARFFDECKPAM